MGICSQKSQSLGEKAETDGKKWGEGFQKGGFCSNIKRQRGKHGDERGESGDVGTEC